MRLMHNPDEKGFPCHRMERWLRGKKRRKRTASQQRRHPEDQATGHITGEGRGAKHGL